MAIRITNLKTKQSKRFPSKKLNRAQQRAVRQLIKRKLSGAGVSAKVTSTLKPKRKR